MKDSIDKVVQARRTRMEGDREEQNKSRKEDGIGRNWLSSWYKDITVEKNREKGREKLEARWYVMKMKCA